MPTNSIKNFYISEDQSIYLLSANDAKKHKKWIELCIKQLQKLGYSNITLLGKGAYGFAFSGFTADDKEFVFKFSRITLPLHIREHLEEEAMMLDRVKHPNVPGFIEYSVRKKQGILVMERGLGADLEQWSLKLGKLPIKMLVDIAIQLAEILKELRSRKELGIKRPIVHGDIKPSNLTYDDNTRKLSLIDWGSSVYAQLDENGHYIVNNVMDLMSSDLQQTNARLGDVYFIGEEQLSGELSSPRFDEQGVASTLYALASAQSCRFGVYAIPAASLGLPKEFALMIDGMLSSDRKIKKAAGDYFIRNIHFMKHHVFPSNKVVTTKADIPIWTSSFDKDIESVVYSSRKSFLREEEQGDSLQSVNDAQLDRYYKNYLSGMGDTEKAFIASISRLAKYPVVGGIVVRWEKQGVFIDSSLNLFDETVKPAFCDAVNNVIMLARAIHRVGIFKCCLFNVKDTIHVERDSYLERFHPAEDVQIPYDISPISSVLEEEEKLHSYFEDGQDPDEKLILPYSIMQQIERLNSIHHTGCIIFEVLPKHLKIHNYYKLLDVEQEEMFKQCLQKIIECVHQIEGEGVSGYMKLPYKDTRYFEHCHIQPTQFMPRSPFTKTMKINT
ncbi:protein kinase domain-containing protein [Flocculibacter collagenilyticus]|uniref:protein kinase domain-containing protein n=1 Tax=Flocculibacter collagenilyticus TaxID=2744479 RepID=UPI0018F79F57|nr:protein kinase [Flocculibacter collagenilyticus]